jgi:ABC-type antimicrobial peptide transport system permease subunit
MPAYPSAVAIDMAAGRSGQSLAAPIAAANPDGTPGGTYRLPSERGAAILDAGEMGSQPLALALVLAGAAVLSLGLSLLSSVRQRRRELALLKALGMTRRQVGAIITWQTTLTLAIAIGAGAPLGIATGRWAWGTFAGSLGVDPVTVVPVLLLAAGGATLILAGNLLAAVPAVVALRTDPAAALRAE